jgi:hypothetical protein
MLVVVHARALIAVECRVLVVQNFFLDGQKVVSVVVIVWKLVAGCRWLGVAMRVVAIHPGASVQTAMFRVATAVVEERSGPWRTCGGTTDVVRTGVS